MTNKIIEAAREAEAYATSQTNDIVDWRAIAQERFYALAYKQGLEDAAKVAEDWKTDWAHSLDVAEAIRKLKEQQHG